jgi:hypothetical protein
MGNDWLELIAIDCIKAAGSQADVDGIAIGKQNK